MSNVPNSTDAALTRALLAFAHDVDARCRAEYEARGSQLPPETRELLRGLANAAQAHVLSPAAVLTRVAVEGTLRVLESPSAASVGQVLPLRGINVAIRRDARWAPVNSIILVDPDVSRDHACIVRTKEGHRISDPLSTNGTFVNGKRLEGAVVLRAGDRIRVGDTILEYQPAAPETSIHGGTPKG